jgi:hypothetical protein
MFSVRLLLYFPPQAMLQPAFSSLSPSSYVGRSAYHIPPAPSPYDLSAGTLSRNNAGTYSAPSWYYGYDHGRNPDSQQEDVELGQAASNDDALTALFEDEETLDGFFDQRRAELGHASSHDDNDITMHQAPLYTRGQDGNLQVSSGPMLSSAPETNASSTCTAGLAASPDESKELLQYLGGSTLPRLLDPSCEPSYLSNFVKAESVATTSSNSGPEESFTDCKILPSGLECHGRRQRSSISLVGLKSSLIIKFRGLRPPIYCYAVQISLTDVVSMSCTVPDQSKPRRILTYIVQSSTSLFRWRNISSITMFTTDYYGPSMTSRAYRPCQAAHTPALSCTSRPVAKLPEDFFSRFMISMDSCVTSMKHTQFLGGCKRTSLRRSRGESLTG